MGFKLSLDTLISAYVEESCTPSRLYTLLSGDSLPIHFINVILHENVNHSYIIIAIYVHTVTAQQRNNWEWPVGEATCECIYAEMSIERSPPSCYSWTV